MTPEQIIKALECCSSRKNCEENCPYFELKKNFFECVQVSTSDAIDLIRRQKEEIDGLKYNAGIREKRKKALKAEAIKEFEDKLYNYIISNKQVNEVMIIEKMTSLKKEMGCGEQ